MSQRLGGLNELSGRYKGILCDVWGVLHNGVAVYPEAADALARFRAAGGHVVMITNSPRPRDGVVAQLRELGVSEDVYDEVVTSGDVTRDLITQTSGGVFHLGPERDLPLFAGLDFEIVPAEAAKSIVCSGLFDDESESPDDYVELLTTLVERKLPFICANPDIVVERGDRLIWCAGSLAKLYADLGGEVRIAGKPHPPIYALASSVMNNVAGQIVDKSELLAIGDGMPTDVAGAQAFGSSLLYISGGIHAREYGPTDAPDEKLLTEFLKAQNARPNYWLPRLSW